LHQSGFQLLRIFSLAGRDPKQISLSLISDVHQFYSSALYFRTLR
jgi:hypothetical protein